jgi:hypothetical protein
MVEITFTLVGMTTVAELVASITSDDAESAIIGLHVISIQCDGCVDSSETFIATPIPGAAWLFGSALLGMVGWSRRKAAS